MALVTTKSSLFKAWIEMLETHSMAPLPLSTKKMQLFCSVMRAAGFRSTFSYILEAAEARQRHLKEGSAWNPQLDLYLKECKRVCTCGFGPPRSEEIKIEWLQELFELEGGVVIATKPTAPHRGRSCGRLARISSCEKSSWRVSCCMSR